ncbi:MAG: dihydrofolate reductase [Acidobacteriota bacterium]
MRLAPQGEGAADGSPDSEGLAPRGLEVVVAVAENGVIGRGGELPWRLSRDLRHFKELTWGHWLLMGRKTFQSIGRPLPGRETVVLSRQGFGAEGVNVVPSLKAALERVPAGQRAFVVGGAAVYAEALPFASRLHWTAVHGEPKGDVLFPAVDWERWELEWQQAHGADERHDFDFTFRRYRRRAEPGPGAESGTGA